MMKKILFALLIALMGVGNVWANHSTHYGKVVAYTMGNGTVYLSTFNTSKTGGSESVATAGAAAKEQTWNCGGSSSSDSKTYYAYATPADGYYFAGWSTSNTSNTKASTDNPYAVKGSASSTSNSSPTTTNIYAYFELIPQAKVTLSYPDAFMGSLQYTCDGVTKTITEQTVVETTKAFDFKVYLNSNYKVLRWWKSKDGGKSKTTLATFVDHLDNQSFLEDCMVGVEIISSTTPVFQVKNGDGTFYTDLTAACNVAKNVSGKTVVLVEDGILAAGNYTIPSGVTLLIPFDANNDVYTTMPPAAQWDNTIRKETYTNSNGPEKDTSVPFRTLTIASNATIIVSGAISLSGEHWVTSWHGTYGTTIPSVSGDFRIHKGYGNIRMEKGSHIEIANGGNLYCWGRIGGDGTICVKSGASAYESLVYTDHRELEAYGVIINKTKCFSMNQLYIQDIQVPITYEYGSKGVVATGMFHSKGYSVRTGTMNFVGGTDWNSMFVLPSKDAKLTKTYNIEKDYLIFDLDSGASMNYWRLKIGTYDFSTTNHMFPITNNWILNIHSGTTEIKYDLSFLPGSELNVMEGARVNIAEKASIFVYDSEDWNGNNYATVGKNIIPLFLPSWEMSKGYYNQVTKTYKNWKETYKVIRDENNLPDAKFTINGTLCFGGGTNALYSADNKNSGLYTTNGGAHICSNGTGVIIYTQGSGTQTYFQQIKNAGRGKTGENANGTSTQAAIDFQIANVSINPAKLLQGDGSYYSTANYTDSTTFKYFGTGSSGKWGKVSTISFKDGDQTIVAMDLAEGETVNAPGTAKDGYTFQNWNPAPPQTMPGENVECTAQWTINKYTISFNTNGGSDVNSITQDYKSPVTAPANPTRKGYNFAGWEPEVPANMPLNGCTCVAQWEKATVVINSLDIKSNETVVTKSDESTEKSQNNTYEVEEDATVEASSIAVTDGATLQIDHNANVTTATLALSTTPSVINLPDEGPATAGTAGQIINNGGTLTVTGDVYIDIHMDASGTLNGNNYYAFAVPFKVHVDGGVQKVDTSGNATPAINQTHYRAYTYNGEKRAANGKNGSAWELVNSGTFNPGVFYLIEFADGSYNTFRFHMADDKLNNEGNIDVEAYGQDTKPGDGNNGWNGIANNALYTTGLTSGVTHVQVYDPAKRIFTAVPLSSTSFAIGTPMMIQVTKKGTVSHSYPAAAPARYLAAEVEDNTLGNYTVRIKADGAAKMADQLFISACENASNEYVIGKDLVKMFMGNATAAQLWVNDYGKKLSVNQAVLSNGVAESSVTLYAPKAGDYEVYLKDIPEDATIYLMQNGSPIANLNNGACSVSLNKGENTTYGLRIHAKNRPNVTTSLDEAWIGNKDVKKVLINGTVYIVRDGQLFNTLGQKR